MDSVFVVISVTFGCLLQLQLQPALAYDQYVVRMMRNPGLSVYSNAACIDLCASACQSRIGCSAVSYETQSGKCLHSMCNNLDLVSAIGWITVVIAAKVYENSTAPAPQLEWMLTDACGTSNQGVRIGPNMHLVGATWSPSLSTYAGNTATFSGVGTASYGVSDMSSACNFGMGDGSLSVMFWAYWNAAQVNSVLVETALQGPTGNYLRGMAYWYYLTGIAYGAVEATTVVGGTAVGRYDTTVVLNTWYHIAYVYDGTAKITKIYVNSTLVSVFSTSFINAQVWQYVTVASSFVHPESAMNGRIFCLKIHDVPLVKVHVAALGRSCADGKIRFS